MFAYYLAMDLYRLRSFVALAEELHFRRAAERMHITQPALSQHLRHLEDDLQAQLVHRNKRRVSLTPAGEALAREARKLLWQADYVSQLVRRTSSGESGQLLIGCTAPATFIILPEIMRAVATHLPDVSLTVQEMTTAEQEAALRQGEIQLGLVHPPLDDTSIAFVQIAELPFKVVISDMNPLSRKSTLELRDLESQHFIMFPRRVGPRLYDQIVMMCRDAGFSPQMIHEASPAQSIVGMAASNFGVGWIASRHQQFPRRGVVYREIVPFSPKLTLGVAFHRDETSVLVKKFLSIAKRVGKAAI